VTVHVPTCAELAKRTNSRELIVVHQSDPKTGDPKVVTLTPKGQAEITAAMLAAARERSTP
jgi:hypothetical protein